MFAGSRILSKMSLEPRLRERSEEKATSRSIGKGSMYIGNLYGLTNVKEVARITARDNSVSVASYASVGAPNASHVAAPL